MHIQQFVSPYLQIPDLQVELQVMLRSEQPIGPIADRQPLAKIQVLTEIVDELRHYAFAKELLFDLLRQPLDLFFWVEG